MPPKLVASDLDGTLVRSDGTIDDRTRRAIADAEAASATVVFCTARPHRGLQPLAEATGHRGVAVCNNGAMLWDLHTESVIESSPLEPAVKLMLRHDTLSADALLTRAREACGHMAEFSHSSTTDALLEISAAGVSKATALARLCGQRGIGREDVVAFGDMPNDVPMLAWAGYAVAVANAHSEVRAAADEVTASNDESGVALVLERLFS